MSSTNYTKEAEDTQANLGAQDIEPVMQFGPIIETLEKHGPIFLPLYPMKAAAVMEMILSLCKAATTFV